MLKLSLLDFRSHGYVSQDEALARVLQELL